MANDKGKKALSDAFDRGYNAFLRTGVNQRGFHVNPPNMYMVGTLAWKEFERGYNQAHSDNLKKVV